MQIGLGNHWFVSFIEAYERLAFQVNIDWIDFLRKAPGTACATLNHTLEGPHAVFVGFCLVPEELRLE